VDATQADPTTMYLMAPACDADADQFTLALLGEVVLKVETLSPAQRAGTPAYQNIDNADQSAPLSADATLSTLSGTITDQQFEIVGAESTGGLDHPAGVGVQVTALERFQLSPHRFAHRSCAG
jgi:hypothetical protein